MSTLLLLPGDGIGPEVCAQVRRVAAALTPDLHVEEADLRRRQLRRSRHAPDRRGPRPALASDAVLMGAVGGPQWANAPRHLRPEAGLLNLRKAMDVYANLRPAYCFEALADASSLKRELVSGLDIMFVRELTGGVYFGEPRGIEDLGNGQKRGIDTQVYTTAEIERVAAWPSSWPAAAATGGLGREVQRHGKSGLLWKQVVTDLHARDYADVQLEHILADNCAMQLVRAPKQFDVIVTDNLFGDILSDAAAMLTGSLGMLPSAALGAAGKPGLYEPIHGSAPTSPARAWPIRWPPSCRSRWPCAGR
jgi:3-isopropylmalate dehydrogenase